MARKRQTEKELSNLLLKIERIFIGSPLVCVCDLLSLYVAGTLEALKVGASRPAQDRNVVEFCSALVERLPHSFGQRFALDSAITSTLADEWSNDAVRLSRMIVPRYLKDWGHGTVTLPVDTKSGYPIDVILMPGEDDLTSVDLLDYPWLCHELGHNLHFQTDAFARCFQERLSKRLTGLRSRTVADTGAAKARSLATIDRIVQHWTPSRDHNNWPYEIAVDVVAVWTCGPAFLAAFEHMLSERNPGPYYLNQAHPPYVVRVAALIDAAQRLCWGDYVQGLEQIKNEWRFSSASRDRTNEFVALADSDLVNGAVTCALSACGELRLPLLTGDRIRELRQSMQRDEMPGYGSDLILSAWIAENDMDDDRYDAWHTNVVNMLAGSVTLESR